MTAFLNAVLGLGGIGLVFGILLAIADEKLKLEVNPLEEKILGILPGANCGACGFPGCSGYAHQIATGNAPPNKCVAGAEAVAKKLSELLGVDVSVKEKILARLKCQGGHKKAINVFNYDGVFDCQIAILASSGPKACHYGCLGFGTCARVCPFKAIKMDEENGLPLIDKNLCTGCGICVTECPKRVISLVAEKSKVVIGCSSLDKGVEVKKKCSIGCIACQLCVKKCPQQAIFIKDNLAVIDYSKCNNCLECVAVCPTKAIYSNS